MKYKLTHENPNCCPFISLQDYLRELHLSNTNTTAPSAAAASAIEDNLPPELKTNFTNAAILLQNSSSVYSRKVEYLYNLVYKALDDLTERDRENAGAKNGSGNPKGKRRRNADPDIEEFENFDPDWNVSVHDMVHILICIFLSLSYVSCSLSVTTMEILNMISS